MSSLLSLLRPEEKITARRYHCQHLKIPAGLESRAGGSRTPQTGWAPSSAPGVTITGRWIYAFPFTKTQVKLRAVVSTEKRPGETPADPFENGTPTPVQLRSAELFSHVCCLAVVQLEKKLTGASVFGYLESEPFVSSVQGAYMLLRHLLPEGIPLPADPAVAGRKSLSQPWVGLHLPQLLPRCPTGETAAGGHSHPAEVPRPLL